MTRTIPAPRAWPALLLAAAAALSGAPAVAHADGVVVRTADLSAEDRAALEVGILAAKASTPAAFKAVAAVDTYTREGAKRLRSPNPSATRAFRSLGAAALWPLLEVAAVDAKRGPLSDTEWRALGSGILEALTVLKDERARPVLRAAMLHAKDPVWADDAAEGLGVLCGVEDEALLLARLRESPAAALAALEGLGQCRTVAVAERVAAFALDAEDASTRTRAARALGLLGSTWALAVEPKLTAPEKERIRRVTEGALQQAARTWRGASQAQAAKSLRMTEDARPTAPRRPDPTAR